MEQQSPLSGITKRLRWAKTSRVVCASLGDRSEPGQLLISYIHFLRLTTFSNRHEDMRTIDFDSPVVASAMERCEKVFTPAAIKGRPIGFLH
jgi:hypothetical protein